MNIGVLLPISIINQNPAVCCGCKPQGRVRSWPSKCIHLLLTIIKKKKFNKVKFHT